jgi:hypothetical protein
MVGKSLTPSRIIAGQKVINVDTLLSIVNPGCPWNQEEEGQAHGLRDNRTYLENYTVPRQATWPGTAKSTAAFGLFFLKADWIMDDVDGQNFLWKGKTGD